MEVKAAKYFDSFQEKSQGEQLEFINDSRKQIEELIGEVKFILLNEVDIPIEIKERISIHINELSSDNFFSRLGGLKNLLDSLLLLNVNNKSISEFLEKNGMFIDEYVNELNKVEVTQYAFDTTKYGQWLVQIQKSQLSPDMMKAAYEIATYKPFAKYEKLLVDCINKIAKNDKKGFFSEDFSFTEDEVMDSRKWLARVRKSENGGTWILIFEMLVSFIKDIHDERVKMMKDKSETEIKNKEVFKQKREQDNHLYFLEKFIKENDKYINLFIREVKEKESKKDSFCLTDKTVFDTKVEDFIVKLSKHLGYKSIKLMQGYYPEFEDDLKRQLEIFYKTVIYKK